MKSKRLAFTLAMVALLAALGLYSGAGATGEAKNYMTLGYTYYSIGLVDVAMNQFRAAVRAEPDNAEARLMLALAYDARNESDQALTQYMEAARRRPDDGTPLVLAGERYLKQGDVERAANAFQGALDRDPEAQRAMYGLAVTQELAGNGDEAIHWLRKLVEDSTLEVDAYVRLGRLLLSHQDAPAEAAEVLEKGRRLDDRNSELYYQLGQAYERTEEIDKAVHAYRRVLDLTPGDEAAATVLERLNPTAGTP